MELRQGPNNTGKCHSPFVRIRVTGEGQYWYHPFLSRETQKKKIAKLMLQNLVYLNGKYKKKILMLYYKSNMIMRKTEINLEK